MGCRSPSVRSSSHVLSFRPLIDVFDNKVKRCSLAWSRGLFHGYRERSKLLSNGIDRKQVQPRCENRCFQHRMSGSMKSEKVATPTDMHDFG